MTVMLLCFSLLGAEPEIPPRNPSGVPALDSRGRVLTETLDDLLHSPEPETRRRAAWSLTTCGDPSVVMPLIQALRDPEANVRKEAIGHFSNYPDARAVEPLITLLKDADPSVRNEALHTIGLQEDPRVIPPLLEILQDANEDCPNRWAAAWDLWSFRDQRALEPFLAVLGDRLAPPSVRYQVAEGLLALKDKRAVEPLMAVLRDRSEPELARAGAARALADFDDQRATGLMLDVARAEGDVCLRFWAAIGAANLTRGAIDSIRLLEPIADYFDSEDGVELDATHKRKALGLVVQNGKAEEVRVMAARLFLQIQVLPWDWQKEQAESKHPDDPGTLVIQGDQMLRAFRLSEVHSLLEKGKTLLPKVADADRRARLEALLLSDLAALREFQQRWATASPAEIAEKRRGITALSGKALIFFQGDPFIEHHARPWPEPVVPVGTDADVQAIKIDEEDVSDTDLASLQQMPNLEILDLGWSSHITGAGLQAIQGLKSLRKLRLLESTTDHDLRWLHGLRGLEVLDLASCKITDEGLRQLTDLKNLQSLYLSGEEVTDQAIEHLKSFPRLSRLSLRHTAVTDGGLQHLTQLKNLKVLNLGWTSISDVGVEHLAELGQLEELWLNDTHVTERGFEKLNQSLPHCRIVESWCLAGPFFCPFPR